MIIKVITKNNIYFMINIIKDIKNSIIAIDFEFKKIQKNSRNIALCQININNKYIFIFYPPSLQHKQHKIFINLLLNNKVIIHGAESLDILYIFNNLLYKNQKNIIKFIKNIYDTKFICEYYHYIIAKNNKCSLYDYLEELQVINYKEIKILRNLEKRLGEIYLIEFNINTLTPDQIKYAYFDVYYLINLYYKLTLINNIPLEQLNKLTGIIYYYKIYNFQIYKKFYDDINICNNYFFYIGKNKFKLIDAFYYYYYDQFNNKTIINFTNVKYFKEFIELIIKFIVYKHFINYKTIYSSKNIIATNINPLDFDLNLFLFNQKNIIDLFNFDLKIYNI